MLFNTALLGAQAPGFRSSGGLAASSRYSHLVEDARILELDRLTK